MEVPNALSFEKALKPVMSRRAPYHLGSLCSLFGQQQQHPGQEAPPVKQGDRTLDRTRMWRSVKAGVMCRQHMAYTQSAVATARSGDLVRLALRWCRSGRPCAAQKNMFHIAATKFVFVGLRG